MAGFDLSGMSGSPSFQGGAGGSAKGGNTSTTLESGFNSAGWTVAVGGSQATGGISQWVLIGAGVLALIWILKRR